MELHGEKAMPDVFQEGTGRWAKGLLISASAYNVQFTDGVYVPNWSKRLYHQICWARSVTSQDL